MEQLLAKLQDWMLVVQARHGVNPVVFLVLMMACAPFFYYSIYRLAKAAARREGHQLNLWGAVFLASTALPYLYVLVMGRNMPWYIYLILAALLGQGAYSLIMKLRPQKGPGT
jgi:membrane protein insertase Oxa1/YidC/SpoIIIJ